MEVSQSDPGNALLHSGPLIVHWSRAGCQADRTQLPRPLPRHVTGRREHRDGGRGRDAQVLERVQVGWRNRHVVVTNVWLIFQQSQKSEGV